MAKRDKVAVASKFHPLKVSKQVKTMAASSALRGGSYKGFIRIMGEAEDSYKKTGRLVLGAGNKE